MAERMFGTVCSFEGATAEKEGGEAERLEILKSPIPVLWTERKRGGGEGGLNTKSLSYQPLIELATVFVWRGQFLVKIEKKIFF